MVVQRILLGCMTWLGFLLLAGCGFHPVYGSHDANGVAVDEQLNQVEIDPIADRPGQILRNNLIDRFYRAGRPVAPLYHLTIKLRIVEQDLGTLANGTTTLAAIQAYGDYTLKDKDGKTLVTGTTNSTGQYDKLTSMYGTLAAHDSALERSVHEVGEQLATRVSLYFSERPTTP